jgi:eukaryotic-like serine/threonine-protein kinase
MLQCPRCGRRFSNDVLVCPADQTPLQADATIADVPIDPLLRRVFDEKYQLTERLGGGGMGTVYRGTHLFIDKPVAIKVLSQRFVGDDTAQQRFRREARAAGRMQHPNAVSVTDFGATTDGYLYIVMELLEGHTLRDVLLRDGPLDTARAVSIMLQTCAAVAAAHDAGLIHRDLKPANIFIAQRPDTLAVVKVLDFGVAKFAVEEQADDDYETLTQVGALIGTFTVSGSFFMRCCPARHPSMLRRRSPSSFVRSQHHRRPCRSQCLRDCARSSNVRWRKIL